MKVLVANIGERDVYYNVGTDEKPDFCHFEFNTPDCIAVSTYLNCPPGARYIGEQILNRLAGGAETEYDRLRFPILYPVLKQMDSEDGKLRIFLTVTDQPGDVKDEYRRKDTIYSGQVLRKLIPRYFDITENEIFVKQYTENPSARSTAYDFYKSELIKWVPPDSALVVYLSLSGGVPALNDALLYRALQIYKQSLRPFTTISADTDQMRLGISEGSLETVAISPFLRDMSVQIIDALLDRYDYSGALDVLNALRAVRFWSVRVEAVIRHANYRLNLKFAQAAECLQLHRDKDASIERWWRQCCSLDLSEKLKELYFQIESCYNCEDYTGMIWRIATVYENARFLVGILAMGLDTRNLPKGRKLYRQALGKHWAPLIKKLNASQIKTSPDLDYIEFKNNVQLSALIDYATGLTGGSKYGRIQHEIDSLKQLAELRNQVIHNISGIGINNLRDNFKGDDKKIIPQISKIIGLVALTGEASTWANPYKDINEWLRKELSGQTAISL